MSTRDLVNAIIIGDSIEIERALNQTLAEKISVRLQEARVEYARKMFRADATMDEQGPCQCPYGGPMRMRRRLRGGAPGTAPGDVTPIGFQAQQQGPSEEFDFELAERLADAFSEEQLNKIEEVLSKSATAGEWISDFVHSDDPRFKGKSKEKRKQMALAAYYAKTTRKVMEKPL